MSMRWVEDEIAGREAAQKRLDEAVALLKDIVDRGLLPAGTEYRVRSFLDRLPT
jgi:hypothetical protein